MTRIGTPTLILLVSSALMASCASTPKAPKSQARAAASSGDYYFLDDYPPEREVHDVKFYFKKCALENEGARAGVGRSFECTLP